MAGRPTTLIDSWAADADALWRLAQFDLRLPRHRDHHKAIQQPGAHVGLVQGRLQFAFGKAQFYFSGLAAGARGQQQGTGQANPAQRLRKNVLAWWLFVRFDLAIIRLRCCRLFDGL